MSEKHLINFIKASKHINILDLVKSPVYSDIDSEQYQGFRSKILALTQKFEKYLDREHEKFVKSTSHVDNLTKTANQIRKKFRSKAKREQLTKLILQEGDLFDNNDDIPSYQVPQPTPVDSEIIHSIEQELANIVQYQS
jgi:hypothetical protein